MTGQWEHFTFVTLPLHPGFVAKATELTLVVHVERHPVFPEPPRPGAVTGVEGVVGDPIPVVLSLSTGSGLTSQQLHSSLLIHTLVNSK